MIASGIHGGNAGRSCPKWLAPGTHDAERHGE
jgi:hypothetical protein